MSISLVVSCAFTLTPAHGQSTDYNESTDVGKLAGLPNTRMHYQRLSSPLRPKTAVWAGLENEIDALLSDSKDYARLEALVHEKSASQLQALVAQGAVSYEQITRYFIARIYAVETDNARYLNAVIALNPRAIEAAKLADRKRSEGKIVAQDSLFGLPILLKDNIGFESLPTTAGAVALAENFAADAFVTQRLKANGVVILGKANLSEWAYFFCTGCPSGYSALGGQTLNPYGRLKFTTGGSSAGSGAAIAGGF
ncbi:MAG: amidase family protein, partial [OM182 bacterium]|nr:amidase family protein [OM182 bacterium]